MSPLLDSPPVLQDDDIIGLLNSRQTVGNGDGCTVSCSPIEGGLNYLLAFRIDGAGGLVEDDDRWFLDDASSDG
jgi:hypothetical protein